MSAFLRFPELRVLRLHLGELSGFHAAAGGGRLNALTALTITGLPPRPWGQEMLPEVAPHLTSVNLAAEETLWSDAAFPSSVRDVSLTAAKVVGPTRLPETLDRLSIHLTAATDEDVAALLDGVTHIKSLSLRGTPVSDAIVPVLSRYDLDHLDLVDTELTDTALSGIRAERPGIRMFPRPPFQNNDA
ncbi:hypothetical protein [Actinomadura geliboluensis]|uniref:hypothetical protein n=1 Tax=Actinomadura geliboluensis TaxID=882440 RepID=UPI003722AAEE